MHSNTITSYDLEYLLKHTPLTPGTRHFKVIKENLRLMCYKAESEIDKINSVALYGEILWMEKNPKAIEQLEKGAVKVAKSMALLGQCYWLGACGVTPEFDIAQMWFRNALAVEGEYELSLESRLRTEYCLGRVKLEQEIKIKLAIVELFEKSGMTMDRNGRFHSASSSSSSHSGSPASGDTPAASAPLLTHIQYASMYGELSWMENAPNAIEYLKIGATKIARSMALLGDIYLQGTCGAERDLVEAQKWFKKSLAVKGEGELTPKSRLQAEIFLRQIKLEEDFNIIWAAHQEEYRKKSSLGIHYSSTFSSTSGASSTMPALGSLSLSSSSTTFSDVDHTASSAPTESSVRKRKDNEEAVVESAPKRHAHFSSASSSVEAETRSIPLITAPSSSTAESTESAAPQPQRAKSASLSSLAREKSSTPTVRRYGVFKGHEAKTEDSKAEARATRSFP